MVSPIYTHTYDLLIIVSDFVYKMDLESLESKQINDNNEVNRSLKKRKTNKKTDFDLESNNNEEGLDVIDLADEDEELQEQQPKKIKPNFTDEDSVIFAGYLVDLNPFKEIGKYAAWIVYDLNLKVTKVTQKKEYESKYDELDKLVNNNQFKVTDMEIHKILNGLKLIQVNEDT